MLFYIVLMYSNFVVNLLLDNNTHKIATKMATVKEPVKLRKRLMPSGITSLYLDIYVNGKRSYEYLHLYLTNGKSREDKERDRKTLLLAEAIRAKRVVEVQNGRYGFANNSKSKANFVEYYESLIEKKVGTTKTASSWQNALAHWRNKFGDDLTFADINAQILEDFKSYLRNCKSHKSKSDNISTPTAALYFHKIRACINHAYKHGIITENPTLKVDNIKSESKERTYLTTDEVRKLAATECKSQELKRAFLFSCITGLRKSDIIKLTWGEVRQEGEFTRIVFTQKKTHALEYIDINPQAAALMGERKAPSECVFVFNSLSPSTIAVYLRVWALNAGIAKDITFHVARHTFAVMMLSLDVDIYTVQKLLGHRSLETTQVYAKVIDAKKQEAAMRIPSILGGENE